MDGSVKKREQDEINKRHFQLVNLSLISFPSRPLVAIAGGIFGGSYTYLPQHQAVAFYGEFDVEEDCRLNEDLVFGLEISDVHNSVLQIRREVSSLILNTQQTAKVIAYSDGL